MESSIEQHMRLVSLFSGIGAFEKAFERTNIPYELVGFSEIDKYAIQSYCAIHNVDESLNLGDVSQIRNEDLPQNIDMITYGFPCQDISISGYQKGITENTRSGLLFEAERIIEYTKPKFAIAENVKNLVGKKFKDDFEALLDRLDSYGYNNYWSVLNAKDYGIPQNRERVFILSIRKDVDTGYEFPKGFDNGLRLKDLLEDEVEDKYYIDNDRTSILLNNLKDKEMLLGGINVSKQGKVFDGSTEVASCLLARDYKGLGNQSMTAVAEPIIVASRGRNPDNPSDRTVGSPTEQRLEPNSQGITNTLTTVQKDNLVLEKIVCEQRTDEGLRFFKDKVCGTIRTIDSGGDKRVIEKTPNEIQMIEVEQLVKVRKYEVDVDNLITCLREHKEKSKLTSRQIAEALDKPITLVEHWFRRDSSFAIPDEDVWHQLKDLLEIKTDEFDLSITEFEEKEGVYEKGNRFYHEKGIAPTLTTSANERIIEQTPNELKLFANLEGGKWDKIHESARRVYDEEGISPTIPTCGGGNIEPKVQTDYKIRKLTPKECWRLMGFDDDDYWKARTRLEKVFYKGKDRSNSQMYKQAGNSIVVNVIEQIYQEMRKARLL